MRHSEKRAPSPTDLVIFLTVKEFAKSNHLFMSGEWKGCPKGLKSENQNSGCLLSKGCHLWSSEEKKWTYWQCLRAYFLLQYPSAFQSCSGSFCSPKCEHSAELATWSYRYICSELSSVGRRPNQGKGLPAGLQTIQLAESAHWSMFFRILHADCGSPEYLAEKSLSQQLLSWNL